MGEHGSIELTTDYQVILYLHYAVDLPAVKQWLAAQIGHVFVNDHYVTGIDHFQIVKLSDGYGCVATASVCTPQD